MLRYASTKTKKSEIILANGEIGHLGALRWGSPFPELHIQNGPVSDHPDRESCHESDWKADLRSNACRALSYSSLWCGDLGAKVALP